MLRYASWREAIAECTGGHPDDLLPQTIGQISPLLDATMVHLRSYLAD